MIRWRSVQTGPAYPSSHLISTIASLTIPFFVRQVSIASDWTVLTTANEAQIISVAFGAMQVN
jgi:hypothetical protein